MSVVSRVLAAVLAVGALLVGLLASTASAGTVATTLPVADPPSVVQLCAATSVEQVDSVLASVAATDLVGGLEPLLTLTVPSGQGLTLKQDVTLDSVRKALDCSSTPTSTPTSTPPTSTSTAPAPAVKTCTSFDSRDAAQDAYDDAAAGSALRARLDPDGDGKACEANEGASSGNGSTPTGIDPTADDGSTPRTDGTQVVEVPDGSASTGGGV